MTVTYIVPIEYPPLPYWHYRGMDGTPAWFSELHKQEIVNRFERVSRENSAGGVSMRFCHRCEAPIGLMGKQEYEDVHISGCKVCAVCGNETYAVPLEL